MSIPISTFLEPKNSNTFFLLEDKYIKGGLHSCIDHADRDAIVALNRKPGMVVVTRNDTKLWILGEDKTTWSALVLGGGGGGSGQIRQTISHTTGSLAPNAVETFDLPMGKSCLLYDLTVNKAPCNILGYATPVLNEFNPYTFNALPTHLSDDGTTFLSDGTPVFGRRYAVLMNLEDIPVNNLYWKVTNTGTVASSFNLTFSFLPLE